MFILGTSNYSPLFSSIYLYGLIYGFLGFLAMLTFAFQLVKGKSYSHITFLICFFIGLLGMVFTGMGALIFTNGYLDESKGTIHSIKIIDKYTTRSKNSTTHYISFNYWNEEKEIISYAVGRDFYYNVKKDDDIVITACGGRWGYEWVSIVEIPAR